MNTLRSILIVSFFLFGFLLNAQNLKFKKGENYFKNYSYYESIQKYEAINNKTIDICRKLAESYFKIGNLVQAEEYWAAVVSTKGKTADDIYKYASVLAMNKKYTECEKWMLEFNRLAPNDRRGQLWLNNKGFYHNLQQDNGRFAIESLNINTDQEDFGTAYFKDKIVFASTRQPLKMVKRQWNGNNLPFLDLYIAKPDSGLQFGEFGKFYKKINKKYHEGPASFNENVDFMVFTRNNYFGKSSDSIIKLQLFTSEFKDNKWQKPISLPFNSNDYSVGHGSLNLNGDTMYFASDMPGGYGGVDIYRIYRKADKNWSNPQNLGNKINTEGNEMFPFIHPNGLLFFSSDGLLGLGGLDVFMSKQINNEFSEPENLGSPVNSSYDDFAFILNRKEESGYFSSNRPEGKGDDDIYLFRLNKPLNNKKLIRGTSMNTDSIILDDVKVTLYDDKKNILGSIITDSTGKYEFQAEQDKLYSLDGLKPLYSNGYNNVDTHTDDYIVIADLFLEKKPEFSLYCLITDEKTFDPIDSVKVTMYDNLSNSTEVIYTQKTGDFYRDLKNKKLNDSLSYKITIEKENYLTEVHNYKKLMLHEGQYDIHEALNFEMDFVQEGMDLSEIIDINPIYFDVNKDNIKPEAAIELEKIVKVMNDNPGLEIELGSHTDCRASAAYNMDLSIRRANASANYIKSRITKPERINGKGYGETNPINLCECEGNRIVPCTEEEHQKNRRTEFRVTKIK